MRIGKLGWVCLLIGSVALAPGRSSAGLLATYSSSAQFTSHDLVSTGFGCLGIGLGGHCTGTVAHLQFSATTADAGSVHTWDATTNPLIFGTVAAFLTDGNDDPMYIELQTPVSNSTSNIKESALFAGSSTLNGIDLAGYVVDAITFELGADFHVTPIPAVGGSDVGGAFTVRFYGHQAPEPELTLLLAAAAGLLVRHRIARRRG
jgi:hypothetical protein